MNYKEILFGWIFEVMCYMTHKCNREKICADMWQGSERNTEIDSNKRKNIP
jgi:hypothetical protein